MPVLYAGAQFIFDLQAKIEKKTENQNGLHSHCWRTFRGSRRTRGYRIRTERFLDCPENPAHKGTAYGTEVWKTGEFKSKSAMEKAYGMGKNS